MVEEEVERRKGGKCENRSKDMIEGKSSILLKPIPGHRVMEGPSTATLLIRFASIYDQ
jgi:hypothetical protein